MIQVECPRCRSRNEFADEGEHVCRVCGKQFSVRKLRKDETFSDLDVVYILEPGQWINADGEIHA